MQWYPSMVTALKKQLPQYKFIRLAPGAGMVHVWTYTSPYGTLCGQRVNSRLRVANRGGGSLCWECEKHLEDVCFDFPSRDEKFERVRE